MRVSARSALSSHHRGTPENPRAARRLAALVAGPLLCLAGLAAPVSAEEATSNGTYFSFNVSRVSSFSLHTTSPTLSPARIRTRPGYEIGAGVGYRIRDIRIEAKFIYGRLDADSIRVAGAEGSLSGYFDLRGLTVEAVHELMAGARLRPYLGAGLGLVRFRANDVTLAGFPPTEGANTLLSWQLMAGLASTMGRWRFSVGYRYLGMGEQDFKTGPDSLRAAPVRTDAIQAGVHFAF